MQLTNEFRVAAPVETAWPLLTDIARIAPCVPGFKLTGSSDGEYTGVMKVKVGAVSTSYDCVIRFLERDDEQHRAVIAARGRETKGQGGVNAKIVSTLAADGDATKASVVTDVDVTGRVAQFGRGILADVSDRLVGQFVKQLERRLLTPDEPAAGPGGGSPPSGGASGGSVGNGAPILGPVPGVADRRGEADEADEEGGSEALDLLSVAGGPLAKRVAPVAGVLVLLALILLRSRAGGR
jgi:uncharacterized protein